MIDPATDRPLFVSRSIELACQRCQEEGKAESCVHMLHLVPSWQSQERHRKLKVIMQDRPDLIQSELAGLAFDSLQQVFRKCDLAIAFDSPCMPLILNQTIWVVVDPAAGGPSSDYAIVSIVRNKGCVTVCHANTQHSSHADTNQFLLQLSSMKNWTTRSSLRSSRKRSSFTECVDTSQYKIVCFKFLSTFSSSRKTISRSWQLQVSAIVCSCLISSHCFPPKNVSVKLCKDFCTKYRSSD